MDFYQLLGYFSGLSFIKPEMEPSSLLRTALMVHVLDAILCGVIANHSRRNTIGWTIGGLCCGIWALGVLFMLPTKKTE